MNYTNSNKAQFDQSDARNLDESDHDRSPFVQSETSFPLRPFYRLFLPVVLPVNLPPFTNSNHSTGKAWVSHYLVGLPLNQGWSPKVRFFIFFSDKKFFSLFFVIWREEKCENKEKVTEWIPFNPRATISIAAKTCGRNTNSLGTFTNIFICTGNLPQGIQILNNNLGWV